MVFTIVITVILVIVSFHSANGSQDADSKSALSVSFLIDSMEQNVRHVQSEERPGPRR